MSLGENIKKLRNKHGISQYALAKMMGVAQQTVAQWEQSLINPRKKNLDKLSNILKVTPNELFYGKDILIANDKNTLELTDKEQELIKKYRRLPFEGQSTVDTIIDSQYKLYVKKKDDRLNAKKIS